MYSPDTLIYVAELTIEHDPGLGADAIFWTGPGEISCIPFSETRTLVRATLSGLQYAGFPEGDNRIDVRLHSL